MNPKSLSNSERVALIQKQRKRTQYQDAVLSVVGILGFLIFWQVITVTGIVESRYLSTPVQIASLFITKLTSPNPDGAVIGVNILSSLTIALSGFGLAIVIGIPLGLVMGWYKGFDSFMRPLFEIIRPIPPVSWIPLTIVWLGIGLTAKAIIVFFAAFVPCLINSYTGIRQTSEVLKNVAKTCGASNFTIFWKIGIPSSMTLTFAGIKVAIGNAWATLVAAEMLAASSGLGYMILMGRQFGRVDLVILGIVVIGVIGTIITMLIGMLENKVLGWKKL
ncbi:MAG: ABC transporter permease [Clostridia bacterium BRH_c25]|nr:MAG: ABC transporter permease [Clostridia bacterium BRH_c25]